MRVYKIQADAKENRICHSCARNKHKQCDHHMNDSAFDAQDFVSVWCDCFCQGRIGREFDSLMDMTKHYAEVARKAQESERTAKILSARAADAAEQVMEAIRWFDDKARDDEGNLLAGSMREHVDSVLDEFLGKMTRIKRSSEAVIATIAEEGRDIQREELIDQLFTPTPSQHLQTKSSPHTEECLENNFVQCSCGDDVIDDDLKAARDADEMGPFYQPEPGELERERYEQAEDFDAAGYRRRRALQEDVEAKVAQNLNDVGWPVD